MERFVRPLSLCLMLFIQLDCTSPQSAKPNELKGTSSEMSGISRETAILIAKGDSCGNYDFESLNILISEEPNAWRLVFELKDKSLDGGGPSYLIEKKTGKILQASYAK